MDCVLVWWHRNAAAAVDHGLVQKLNAFFGEKVSLFKVFAC